MQERIRTRATRHYLLNEANTLYTEECIALISHRYNVLHMAKYNEAVSQSHGSMARKLER